jgi:putative FmdB family regulatory protein
VPTYQYACTDCGHRFEQVQAFSDASLTDCPVCGGKLRKVDGSVCVVFKGTGFYRTDSRSGTAPATNGADKSDSGSSESGKPAAKEPVKAAAKSSDSGSSSASSAGNGSSSNGASGNGASKKPAAAAKSTS